MEIVLSLIGGMVIGAVLGLLGGGGALMAIPVLIYILGFSFRSAIGTSLALVALGALPAAIAYARKQQVDWLSALYMGIGGALGASVGSRFSGWIPQPILLSLLILLMALSAVTMLRPYKSTHPEQNAGVSKKWVLILVGFGVGVLTGLVGVGGGFLLVPALLLFGNLAPRIAIATSLVIIGINAVFGVIGYLDQLPLSQVSFWLLAGGCLAGGVGGFLISFRLPQQLLKKGFGILLIILMVLLVAFPPGG